MKVSWQSTAHSSESIEQESESIRLIQRSFSQEFGSIFMMMEVHSISNYALQNNTFNNKSLGQQLQKNA